MTNKRPHGKRMVTSRLADGINVPPARYQFARAVRYLLNLAIVKLGGELKGRGRWTFVSIIAVNRHGDVTLASNMHPADLERALIQATVIARRKQVQAARNSEARS